jgi:hypothetical protein
MVLLLALLLLLLQVSFQVQHLASECVVLLGVLVCLGNLRLGQGPPFASLLEGVP